MLIKTNRLCVRDWTPDDVDQALTIYGADAVTRWLAPAMRPIEGAHAMRDVMRSWLDAQRDLVPPTGRWAIESSVDGRVVGGLTIQLLPPFDEDLEIGCQLAPSAWGMGFATEAMHGLMHWAFRAGAIDELYAVARPRNRRAIAVLERLGMQWVGETDKYYSLTLQVYRLRASELDIPNLRDLKVEPLDGLTVLGLPDRAVSHRSADEVGVNDISG